MRNKLVFIGGIAHWMTPEGNFVPAENRNGHVIETVYLRTPRGLLTMENGAIRG